MDTYTVLPDPEVGVAAATAYQSEELHAAACCPAGTAVRSSKKYGAPESILFRPPISSPLNDASTFDMSFSKTHTPLTYTQWYSAGWATSKSTCRFIFSEGNESFWENIQGVAVWMGIAAVLAFSGFLVGVTSKPATSATHDSVRSILYFTSLCIASWLFGLLIDFGVFVFAEALAGISGNASLAFYYMSAFRGVIANWIWVLIALSTFDSILVGVDLENALNVLVIIGCVVTAIGFRRLLLKLFLTEVMRGSLAGGVQQALEYQFSARVLTAPHAWARVRTQTDERNLSRTWQVLHSGDFRAQMSRLARGEFRMYNSSGALIAVHNEKEARVLGNSAYYRFVSDGVTSFSNETERDEEAALNNLRHAALSPTSVSIARNSVADAMSISAPDSAAAPILQSVDPLPWGRKPQVATGAPQTFRALGIDDFVTSFGVRSTADALTQHLVISSFSAADTDNNGAVGTEEFADMFATMFNAWKNVRSTLEGQTGAHLVLERMVNFIFWLVVTFVVLTVSGYNIAGVLVPIGTVTIAVSFAISTSVSNMVQGLVFTILQHPYNVDDVVTIAPMSSLTASTTSLRVKQINVLTTTFVQPDGKHVSMPNPQLSSMSITNLKTSGDAHLGINVKVSYGTPVEAIEALQQAVKAYVANLPIVWKRAACITYNEVVPGQSIELCVNVDPVHPWYEGGRLAVAKSNLIFFLFKQMRHLQITCLSTPTPVYKLNTDKTIEHLVSTPAAPALLNGESVLEPQSAFLKDLRKGLSQY